MNNPGWSLQNTDGCTFFEFRDASYIMKFTVGADQENCANKVSPIFLKQVHSAMIINLDEDDTRIGDGFLARDSRNVMGLKIADCLPVYLYNDKTMCLIHCGWRGILEGIAKKARDLLGIYSYALGACIGVECYEVKYDVVVPFRARYPDAIIENKDKCFLDLKKAVIQDLGEAFLTADLDLCTKCHPEYFFSYRRGDREKRNYALMTGI